MSPAGPEHWDRIYAAAAEDQLSWFEADTAGRVTLITRHLPDRRAAILDVGAGLTRLIGALRAAGYTDITALDISAAAVARARPRVPGVAWVVADVTAWTPVRRFDLWHDRAVLHFLTGAGERRAYRRALVAGTRAGSVAILSTFAPDGPERCSGLPVRRYGAAEMAEFLGPAFRTLETLASAHVTPGGSVQRFHTQVARREAA